MNWKSTLEQPENYQRVIVTDGKRIHSGVFYQGPDKFCLDQGLNFKEGGMYCDFEDNYSHWIPSPELPKQSIHENQEDHV